MAPLISIQYQRDLRIFKIGSDKEKGVRVLANILNLFRIPGKLSIAAR